MRPFGDPVNFSPLKYYPRTAHYPAHGGKKSSRVDALACVYPNKMRGRETGDAEEARQREKGKDKKETRRRERDEAKSREGKERERPAADWIREKAAVRDARDLCGPASGASP